MLKKKVTKLISKILVQKVAFVFLIVYDKCLFLGLRILAFPCNQFAGQEPGNPEEIVCFAAERRVKFDLFEKVDVNGDNASPLWKFLKVRKLS